MTVEAHVINEIRVAEVIAEGITIRCLDDALELLGNLYYQDFDKVIIHQKNITPDFFQLNNGFAGEMLQKFSNYKVRLAIVGDFSKYTGASVRAFIYEANKGRQVNFVASRAEALQVLVVQ